VVVIKVHPVQVLAQLELLIKDMEVEQETHLVRLAVTVAAVAVQMVLVELTLQQTAAQVVQV
jgi:hypothetical protein